LKSSKAGESLPCFFIRGAPMESIGDSLGDQGKRDYGIGFAIISEVHGPMFDFGVVAVKFLDQLFRFIAVKTGCAGADAAIGL
jgi:hypothetical protein